MGVLIFLFGMANTRAWTTISGSANFKDKDRKDGGNGAIRSPAFCVYGDVIYGNCKKGVDKLLKMRYNNNATQFNKIRSEHISHWWRCAIPFYNFRTKLN